VRTSRHSSTSPRRNGREPSRITNPTDLEQRLYRSDGSCKGAMPSSQSEQLAKEKSGGSSLALALPLERRVRSQRSGLASKRLFSFFSLPTYLVFPQRPYCTQVVPVSLLREVGLSRCVLFIVVCCSTLFFVRLWLSLGLHSACFFGFSRLRCLLFC
jgi:hypothetical protein